MKQSLSLPVVYHSVYSVRTYGASLYTKMLRIILTNIFYLLANIDLANIYWYYKFICLVCTYCTLNFNINIIHIINSQQKYSIPSVFKNANKRFSDIVIIQ